ncbi:prolipoprotein diacylglyceryl transferase [Actinomadura logoneensis]|uniref:Phosphatidylglycerol--prolipoprotein diacylglyceryl transferase n=1 Tax=Actinomadura logoneensis TaxID=2293572 RepID=A0A372JC52_9ACTN|nr:prolipoprotein diacylglyceryl transferase [Actinomadura logoneensis]RFU37499.1 prolipoprotein diacylglyceryl transferase [Actinomadura logoneensis]
MQPVAFLPSPSQGVWHLGPIPIRAYALMIILGIVVAVWLGERRWAAKGGQPGTVIDVAVWAVPFGLVGGRLYHVITDYQRYFGDGRDPVNALKIWEGGLGIWGAVVLGAVGAVIGCRRRGISVLALGDAIAPGIAFAQAIGRWGNWWNQELYGRPLDAFWALKIDPAHRPRTADGTLDPKYADVATYHPTFLYESLWCVGVGVLVLWAGRRYRLTHGRAFALYIAAYTVGRFWIEALRIDDAHHVAGLRLNDWTSIIVFLGAVAYLYWARGRTGPEAVGAVEPAVQAEPAAEPAVEKAEESGDTPPAGPEPEDAPEDDKPGRTAEDVAAEPSADEPETAEPTPAHETENPASTENPESAAKADDVPDPAPETDIEGADGTISPTSPKPATAAESAPEPPAETAKDEPETAAEPEADSATETDADADAEVKADAEAEPRKPRAGRGDKTEDEDDAAGGTAPADETDTGAGKAEPVRDAK